MVILMASIVSPTFAYADNKKSEQKGENNSRKSAQMVQKIEKNEIKSSKKEENKEVKKIEIKEIKSVKNDDDDKSHYSTSTATSTRPVKVEQKLNYFLCKTDTGWNVVPLVGEKNKNSNKAMGKYCMKLPYGFAKRFNTPIASTIPDIVAPVISGITASGVTPTGAIVSWTTNEVANGNIYVSTSSPVNMASSTTVGGTSLVTSHSFSISGLSAGTIYYYVVKSADSANNVSTSAQQSFVTPLTPDVTAPIISTVVPFTVASTTATVAWTTNETAVGKLWYGTSTPSTLFATTTSGTIHSFNLIGLTASTTYQLLFEAKDSANNIATGTASLVTTN